MVLCGIPEGISVVNWRLQFGSNTHIFSVDQQRQYFNNNPKKTSQIWFQLNDTISASLHNKAN